MLFKNVLTGVLLAFLCAGCSSLPKALETDEAYSHSGQEKAYVVSHGWHTGFVVPSRIIFEQLPELKQRFEKVLSIEFGWGDKGFYQAKEITSGLTLQAIFWPTESVVHAVGLEESVYQAFPHSEIRPMCLSKTELERLVRFISGSFARDRKGQIIQLRKGIYGNSQFYQGMGDYYLMNTCNKWTAKGLKSIGFDISTMFKLTAGSIMGYLESEIKTPLPTCNESE